MRGASLIFSGAAALAFSTFAACGRSPPSRPKAPAAIAGVIGPAEKVNAAGEQPLWSMQVRPGVLRYSDEAIRPMAVKIARFTTTDTTASWSGAVAGRVLSLTLSAKPCTDAATGLSYPLTASAEASGRKLIGCAAGPGQGLGPRN